MKKRIGVTVAIFFTILSLFLLSKECNSVIESSNYICTDVGDYQLFELNDTNIVEQDFVMNGDVLENICFLFTGFDSTDEGNVNFSIYHNDNEVYRKSILLSQLKNGEFTTFKADAELLDGEEYTIKLCSKEINRDENIPKIVVVSQKNVPSEFQSFRYAGKTYENRGICIGFSCTRREISLIRVSIFACMFSFSLFLFICYICGNSKKNRSEMFFIQLAFSGMVGLLVAAFLSKGYVFSHFFFYDEKDTGMDFLHSIEYLKENQPYAIFGTIYPPLANLLFAFLYNLVPFSVKDNWGLSFEKSVSMRGTYADLRVQQSTLLLYLMFTIISTICFFCIVESILKKEKKARIIAFFSVFSYGFLMAIERGNIIIISAICTIFFVFYRNDEKPIKRELAYIMLSIAYGLKLYPAIFILLLLKEKKWPEMMRTILYGIFVSIVPLFFFQEGWSGINTWLRCLTSFNMDSSAPWVGNGWTNALSRGNLYLSKITGIQFSENLIGSLALASLALCCLIAVIEKEEWKTLLVLTFVCCAVKNQGDYIFIFYIIPLLSFLLNEKKVKRSNATLYISMVLLNIVIPVFYNQGTFYPRDVIVHTIYYIFFFAFLMDFCNYIHEKRSLKNNAINRTNNLTDDKKNGRAIFLKYSNIKPIVFTYISLPVFTFLTFYLRWYIGITCLAVYAVVLFHAIHNKENACEKKCRISIRTMILLGIVVLAWTYLGGLNGNWYQTSDWDCRNAIFRDLITHSWPVKYLQSNSALDYYIGHWLPVAVIAKVFLHYCDEGVAWIIAQNLLWLWTALGLYLLILQLLVYHEVTEKKQIVIVLTIFIFFSGMDIVGAAATGKLDTLLAPDILHLEWWSDGYQFSSITTCIYWVFNQSVIPWLTVMCFMFEKTPRNYMFLCVACLACGPLPLVGLALFMLAKGVEHIVSGILNKKTKSVFMNLLSVENLLCLLFVVPIYLSYYFCNNATSSSLNNRVGEESFSALTRNEGVLEALFKWVMNNILNIDFLLFFFLEVGIYLVLIFRENKKNILYYVAWISLLLIPHFYIGVSIDFCMRASLPALLITEILCTGVLLKNMKSMKRKDLIFEKIRLSILIIALLFGTFTPCVEIGRGIYHVAKAGTTHLAYDPIVTFDTEFVSYNFSTATPDEKFFFKYIAKK